MESANTFINKYLKPIKITIPGNATQSAAELQRDINAMSALCDVLYESNFDLWYKLQTCINKAVVIRARKQNTQMFDAREYQQLLAQ